MESLDSPYDKEILDLIRDRIHTKMVVKITNLLSKKDYKIYFNEDTPNDITWVAGKPMGIILNCSPFDGERVNSLLKRAVGPSAKKILRELLRTMQVVRQSDAMLWFGVEQSSIEAHAKSVSNKRYECREIFNYHKIEVVDLYTNKKIVLEAKNTNVFALQAEAIKLLMKD